jgi:ParB-like chromosome segregation protein Spo0J
VSALEPARVKRAQRSVAELEPHAEAAEVPPLPERDYEALRADTAARGLSTAIEVTAAGVVLDGRARLRACRELGHELIAVDVVAPDDELEHILRVALHRRDGKGFPDLLLLRGRKLIVRELKAGAELTPEQEAWLRASSDASVDASVWTPADWPEIERTLR